MNRRLGGDASLNAAIREDGDSGEWQDWLVDDDPRTRRRGSRRARSSITAARRWPMRSPCSTTASGASSRRGGWPTTRSRSRILAGRVRRLARARAPDRGARLREGAEGGEEPRRRDGKPGALAGALASNPFPWWEKLPMDVSLSVRFTATERRERGAARRVLIDRGPAERALARRSMHGTLRHRSGA